MAVSIHKESVAFFKETTPGSPPADWQASGKPVHVVNRVDFSGLEQQMVEDERSTLRINERGGQMVKSLRSGQTVEVSVYLTGKGATDATVSQTYLMDLLENVMGGINLGTTGEATGGSTTTVTMTDTSAYEAGEIIGIRQNGTTTVYPRRITDNTSNTITVDEALPFTVASGDDVIGAATLFIDPDVLEDSDGASGRTLSWHIRHGQSADARVELLGTKCTAGIGGLGRGELPTITLTVNVNKFYTPGDSDISSNPGAYSNSVEGEAPLALGPSTEVFFQDYGTTTQSTGVGFSALAVEPGIVASAIETVTSQSDQLEAMHAWTTEPANPTAELTIVPHGNAYNADFVAGTYKAFRLARLGAEGSGFCIGMPRAEITTTPKIAENGNVIATTVSLRAHEDVDAIGTTDIAKTPIYLALL